MRGVIELDGRRLVVNGPPKVSMKPNLNLINVELNWLKFDDFSFTVLHFQLAPAIRIYDGVPYIELTGQVKSFYSVDLPFWSWKLVADRINEKLLDRVLFRLDLSELGSVCNANRKVENSAVWVGKKRAIVQFKCYKPPLDHLKDVVRTEAAIATLPKTSNEGSNVLLTVPLPIGSEIRTAVTEFKNQPWPQSCILGPNNEFNVCEPGSGWCSVGWARVGKLIERPYNLSVRFFSWSDCNERTARLSVTYALATPLDGWPINFELNDHLLLPEATSNLVRNILKAGEFSRIIVTGHADASGSPRYNHQLALRRAASVRDFLIASKLATREQIETTSSGEEHPISEGTSSDELARDRRVHLHFIN